MSSNAHPPSDWANDMPKPGYAALRQHRWSAEGAEYFVTIKAHRPTTGLSDPPVLEAIRAQLGKLETEEVWRLRTSVVMPDHLHLLFTLRDSTPLADSIRLFKGRLTPTLRKHQLRWQEGYYEHRMRTDEDRLPVFLYIFLNPYRAKLLASSENYPGYFCCDEDRAWLLPLTNSATPFPAWLA